MSTMNFLTCLPQSLVLTHGSKGTLFHVQYCINIDPCQKNLKFQQQLLDFKSPTLVLIFHVVNLIVPAPARTLNSYNVTGFCSISKTAHKNNSYVLSSLNKNRHLEYANILHISCIGYRRLITQRFIFRLLLFYLFSRDIRFFFQMYF